jgi:carbonic anhydrase
MREIVWRIDDSSGEARPHPADATTARSRLVEGNDLFAELFDEDGGEGRRLVRLAPEELGISSTGKAPEQQPFATVLSCADARVPVEMLFSQRANDLFVVRVAGGVLGESAMGSLDFAVAHLPTMRLIVVLGHTGCGAVSAAVDTYLDPYSYFSMGDSRPLLALVHNLLAPVRLADHTLELVHGDDVCDLPGYRAALLELSVVANAGVVSAAIAARNARRAAAVGRLVQTGFGVYDLVSRRVGVPGSDADGNDVQAQPAWEAGILSPPTSRAAFARLLQEMAAGPRLRQMLGDGARTG